MQPINDPNENFDPVVVDRDEIVDARTNKNMNTGTIRTAVPAAWVAFFVWVADEWGYELPTDKIYIVVPVLAGVVGVAYRAFRELEARWPVLGRIFLGSGQVPSVYVQNNKAA